MNIKSGIKIVTFVLNICKKYWNKMSSASVKHICQTAQMMIIIDFNIKDKLQSKKALLTRYKA